MNQLRPGSTLQEQLQTLVNQYRSEMEHVRALGGPGAPDAQQHLDNANKIKDLLTRFHAQRSQQQQQLQAQQQQQQAQQQAQQQNPPGFDQEQLYAQQRHAQQGQQGAMANMRVMGSLQAQQQQIEEIRHVSQTLEQQLQAAANALRTVDNDETRQRLMRSIQGMRNKREQLRQREQQVVAALNAARQKAARKPSVSGATGQPTSAGSGAGPQGSDGPGGVPGAGPQGPGAIPGQVPSGVPAGVPGQLSGIPGQIPGQAGGVPGGVPGAVPGQISGVPGGIPGQPPTGQPSQPVMSGSVPPANNAPGQPGIQQAPGGATPGTPNPVITGRSTQSLHVPQQLHVNPPTPVNVRSGRPTLISGGATGASALNSPALSRIPHFEVGSDRVLSKRRLSELVAGILGEDSDTLFDGDVEELLLDLADEFVSSVTTFACRLAKHRKSDTLEVKDVQLHLERNWNLLIPGFSSDEVRSIRKIAPTPGYQQKVQGVTLSKSVNK